MNIENISFFVANSFSRLPIYHKIHEFLDLEEFCEPTLKIYSNCRNIRLKLKQLNQFKFFNKNFITIDCNRVGPFLVKDILIPQSLILTNKNYLLFNLLSSRVKVKSILEVNVRFNFLFFE